MRMNKPSLQSQVANPSAEKKFGGYTMLEHLGKGGMGDVYRAIQIGLNRVVAIKILPSLLARSSEFSERFFTEAYAISRLQHQNIVTIYDYGDEDGQKFIAMQFIQGTTLSRIIKDSKSLDYERIVGITKQICRGLKYAHENDIVHRDIKSGNIMIEPGEYLRLRNRQSHRRPEYYYNRHGHGNPRVHVAGAMRRGLGRWAKRYLWPRDYHL
jgi:serine/threonine protein kinase